MSPNVFLPLLTAVLCLVFAVLLAARLAIRRRPYHALWALALVCFAVSSGAEAWGAAAGWPEVLYRWWYLCGAIAVAALLGAGALWLHSSGVMNWLLVAFVVLGAVPALASGYLVEAALALIAASVLAVVQVRGRGGFPTAAVIILAMAIALAAARVFTSDIAAPQMPAQNEIATGRAFADNVRVLTPMFNIPGAALLLLGAILSAVRWRAAPNRLASNVLIALGAFVPSLASTLTRFGDSSEFYASQLVGVACLLAGFVVSDLRPPAFPRG